MSANVRALAAKCCYAVVDKGRSLADELPQLQEKVAGKDKGLLQELCYGVLRYLPELEHSCRQLVTKPLKGKQRVVHFLILVGIYQIKYTRIPDHAAVSESVAATKPLKHFHLKALVNGVLRGFQRMSADGQSEVADAIKFNHPSWFINKIKQAYPSDWQQVLTANMAKPPMWLRVNQLQNSVAHYQEQLKQAKIDIELVDSNSGAIKLVTPVDVGSLPGFNHGEVSIQDGAAQQAAVLLDCQSGDRVLDCCAAPGGKTCHMLELTPGIASMTAIDVDENRLARVKENLSRLNLSAKTIAGDASDPESWWDGELFDRILLDAPCSGTGVIRRHPDIKWLRQASDIDKLVILQQQILTKVWSLLKPGGTLLYATCSILPEENCEQIQQFINKEPNAELVSLNSNSDTIGWQILPNQQSMDGFYYAKLTKRI
ncbi:ribosomal RNA small subunit methyltransferase B [Thalassotalea insulae]|uniref:16S rRNA (cytosine(967)-C(5))-methyltransferase n=1 Tax=Thalassotalea insulae TaxID=2056778 RepID=A0ABQ6GV35_9GAMM|nr:16S rRNA (cytosine(967)-C(5))-methyltransferase RsmB [Thalassotalea insulae]GLX78511.1 ribosomal RNA small subunit methyltransferase B [Thalassotalea insulae]